MGTYSKFCGDVRKFNNEWVTEDENKQLIEALEQISKYSFLNTFFFGSLTDEIKWYNWKEDILELSKQFPEYVFEVERFIEDGYQQKMLAYQGRYDCVGSHTTYDDLNEDYVLGNNATQ